VAISKSTSAVDNKTDQRIRATTTSTNRGCIAMTDTQFAVLIGTIWLAPHSDKWYASFVGLSFILIGAAKGLGWI
jgi:hypothetical protein